MSRSKKLFNGFLIVLCVVIYGTVSEMDYQDQVEHERYIQEWNARKMWEEKFPHDKRPTAVADPAFVGKPSKKYFDGEYAKLRAKYEARRARWEAR